LKTKLIDWAKMLLESKAVTLWLAAAFTASVGANVYTSHNPEDKIIPLPIPSMVQKPAVIRCDGCSEGIKKAFSDHIREYH